MKVFLTLFLFSFINTSLAQTYHKPVPLSSGDLIRIGMTKWIDKNEVVVEDWMEYIYYNNVEFYLDSVYNNISITSFDTIRFDDKLLPDNTIVEKYQILFEKSTNLGYGGSYRGQRMPIPKYENDIENSEYVYETYIKYGSKPIVGIAYEQALDFCKWRTSRDSIVAIQNGYDYWYEYRLPTPEEYDQLNTDMDSLKFRKNNNKVGAAFNYKGAKYRLYPRKEEEDITGFYDGIGEAPCHGIYFEDMSTNLNGIQGNVSEMTNIKGIAKGGSFMNYARECKPGIEFLYTKAEPWLGFRCIAELKKQ